MFKLNYMEQYFTTCTHVLFVQVDQTTEFLMQNKDCCTAASCTTSARMCFAKKGKITKSKSRSTPVAQLAPRNLLTRWDVSSIPANGIFLTKN